MAEGIIVLSVDERPSISRSGKPQNEVVITVETGFGATGQIAIPQSIYSSLVTDPDELNKVLEAKRDELNAPYLATM